MSNDVFKGNTTFTLPGFTTGEVTDQGNRGTCVAVSVIKALEYATASNEKFSPQFLYACCKAQAGNAAEAGLTLQNAFASVQQYGIALNSDCPYNTAQIADEAQIPAERLREVKCRTFDHPLKMLMTPQNVNEYKMILSGASGMKPVPVVTGIRFFDNLLPDGTLNVPGTFDHEIQAHAILIYGWQDTPENPLSRGYFLAQNSWGNIPVLKISYEYMEQFAIEAGYTELSAPAGVTVAAENENKIKSNMQEKKLTMIDHNALAAENEYFGLQKQNMLSEHFSFPDIRSPFPFWEKVARYVPSEPFTSPLADAPVSFADFLGQRQVNHLKCNSVKVYRINAKPGKFYNVISTFLIRTDGQQLTAGDLGLFYDYMESYGPNDKPLHTFMTIGGYPGFDSSCLPLANPTVLLCERKELQLLMNESYSIWQIKSPDAPWSMFTYDFVLHLLPNSYRSVIKMLLDKWPDYQVATVAEIKKKLLLPSRKCDIHDKIIEAEVDKLFLVEYPRFGKNKLGEIQIQDKTTQKFKPRKRFIKSASQLKYEYITCATLRLLCASLIPIVSFAVLDMLVGEPPARKQQYDLSLKFMWEALDNYINFFGGPVRFWIHATCKLLVIILLWMLEGANIRKRLKLEYNIN